MSRAALAKLMQGFAEEVQANLWPTQEFFDDDAKGERSPIEA